MDNRKLSLTPETKCFGCGANLSMHTPAENVDAVPQKDDLSVCAYCGAMGRFDGEGNLQPMDFAAFSQLIEDDLVAAVTLARAREIILDSLKKNKT